MPDSNEKETERIVERIRRSPPPMTLWGWWWRTPASKRPHTETVIEPEFSVGPVVETEETKKAKEGILKLLRRRPF